MKAFAVIGIVLVATAAVLGGVYGYITLYRDAAPRMADAERTTYENSASYVQGKTQELAKYRREYQASKDEKDRAALRELILTTAATVDRSKLPADLRAFVRDLETQKGVTP